MNNCQITFKEDDKMIVVDFTLDDNGDADYNIRFHPEIKDKDEDIGLKGQLCQLFLAAIHNHASDNVDDTSETDAS